MKEIYSVVEVYSGEYRQGFKTREEAVSFVQGRLGGLDDDDVYEYRVVKVLDEWTSEKSMY